MGKDTDSFLIAVDGGGSGCRAAVATHDGYILGEGSAGPANATTDFEQTVANARHAIRKALGAAGVSDGALMRSVAHLGLAGALTTQVTQRIAAGCGLPRVTVSDDLETALAGALGERDGVLVSVGTGSVLASRRCGGLTRIGGWGLQISDQASGAWLGRALLERTLLCHDGLEVHSALTRAVLEDLGGTAMDLVHFAAKARPVDFANLAPRIMSASGDEHGASLLRQGADYLGRALVHLDPGAQAPVCLTGGLGPAYAGFLTEPVQVRLVVPKGTALDGALLLARAAAGRVT